MGLAEHEARSACPFPQPDPARSIWGGGLGCNFAGQTNPRRRLLVLGPLGEGGCFGVIFGFSDFRLTMSCSPTPIIRSTGVISSEVGGWCIHPPLQIYRCMQTFHRFQTMVRTLKSSRVQILNFAQQNDNSGDASPRKHTTGTVLPPLKSPPTQSPPPKDRRPLPAPQHVRSVPRSVQPDRRAAQGGGRNPLGPPTPEESSDPSLYSRSNEVTLLGSTMNTTEYIRP